jgi:hypothetical protein
LKSGKDDIGLLLLSRRRNPLGYAEGRHLSRKTRPMDTQCTNKKRPHRKTDYLPACFPCIGFQHMNNRMHACIFLYLVCPSSSSLSLTHCDCCLSSRCRLCEAAEPRQRRWWWSVEQPACHLRHDLLVRQGAHSGARTGDFEGPQELHITEDKIWPYCFGENHVDARHLEFWVSYAS